MKRVLASLLLSVGVVVGVFKTDVWAAGSNSATDRDLFEAARAGKLDEVRLLLKRGANPNVRVGPRLTNTPLIAAVASERSIPDRIEIIRLLLKAGAEVNFQTEGASTALDVAARLLDADATRLLLEYGADPNLRDNFGRSPLTISLMTHSEKSKHLAVIELLLSKGADPNAKVSPGETPLFYVVQRRSSKMVSLMLQHGANPNGRGDSGKTPLMAAVAGIPDIETPEIIQLLVRADADPNAADNSGQTVAMIAASSDNKEILPLLERLGSRDAKAVARKASFDATAALLQAVHGLNTAKVKLLVTGGANTNVKDANGWTLLHHAANGGNADIVDLIISSGANVNAKSYRGATPLLIAVRRRNTEAVRRLLRAGADPNVKNAAGITPLILAAKYEHIVEIRYGLNAKIIRNLEPGIAKLLLDAGAAPNAEDPDGLTALMFASAQGRLELVKVLLLGGADVNAKGANAVTAWQLAVGDEVVEVLNQARKTGRVPIRP